ncbi:hypothetical protein GGQ99_004730 [Aminobacter niigataensis]|uniref:Uncharacterized protein n=1 Tax=Aminobacter niigataensis TaxID=83265 RepID=A0ABR6L811_9HYPH|nr:hypothetical protein [Aminobacter niigataensis]MBB4652946.1 hypothetical protein [Aminobacter niigataensis]
MPEVTNRDVNDASVRAAGDILMRHINAPEQAVYAAAREILEAVPHPRVPALKPVDRFDASWRKHWNDGWNACIAAMVGGDHG